MLSTKHTNKQMHVITFLSAVSGNISDGADNIRISINIPCLFFLYELEVELFGVINGHAHTSRLEELQALKMKTATSTTLISVLIIISSMMKLTSPLCTPPGKNATISKVGVVDHVCRSLH